ncbi:AbgT family transporter [Celerinatantimonas yamalensis]|uniref:AbgT family transporter n=1 Tax=Celerinatantimonas yamalensis TaxID=559956 RepID=A0ABW9G802_9GAMM
MENLNELKSQRSLRILNAIERIGNRLPDPMMLFLSLAVMVILASVIAAHFGATVVYPASGKLLHIRSLLSDEGVVFILTHMLKNFTGFAPLGLVLGMMLGVGVAEQVGLLEALVKRTILNAPAWLITAAVAFSGIMMNIASDAAMIVLPPLAAMVFLSVGRHPIAGLMCGFASAGAGFTANLIIAGTDALLSGISTEAAKAVDPTMVVTPVDNWYFNIISVFMLTLISVWVTVKIVEPRLGHYKGEHMPDQTPLSDLEKRGLRNAGITAFVYLAGLVTWIMWPNSPLTNAHGGLIPSPFLKGIIPLILCFFIAVGIAYGKTIGVITSAKDVAKQMSTSIQGMSSYIVLIFFAAQFIAYFNWSHLGTWIAVHGADYLKSVHMTGLGILIGYIILTSLLNFLIVSGSAKWALEAPVFIPLFMQLGYSPAFVQVAYRIADSSTNIITPLNPYFVVILSFMKRYDKAAGIGTMISLLMPYTICFLAAWVVLFCLFFFTGLPIGPGVYPMLAH